MKSSTCFGTHGVLGRARRSALQPATHVSVLFPVDGAVLPLPGGQDWPDAYPSGPGGLLSLFRGRQRFCTVFVVFVFEFGLESTYILHGHVSFFAIFAESALRSTDCMYGGFGSLCNLIEK